MPPPAPAGLSGLIDQALQSLQPAQVSPPSGDTYLYSGNGHETVPRALFLDNRLTPLERNTWQIFRLLLNDRGLTAFPTYEQLRPFLSCSPCGAKASHESVAKALTLLRLARWLSLVRRRRDPQTGRLLGNVYVLHHEPLCPYEALQLDPEYLKLLSNALSHPNKGVQRVGAQVLKDICDDPSLKGKVLPDRLKALMERMGVQDGTQCMGSQTSSNEAEEGSSHSLHDANASTSTSEPGRKAASSGSLRNPKRLSTLKSKTKEVRTAGHTELRLPELFTELTGSQRKAALLALQNVDDSLKQAVLNEWAARCNDRSVRSRVGYLFGLITRAAQGEFKVWAADRNKTTDSQPPKSSPSPQATKAPTKKKRGKKLSKVAEKHIAELKAFLHVR